MKKNTGVISAILAIALGTTLHAAQRTAGRATLDGAGSPDGWTNILYINEDAPFDFAGTGSDQGVLTNTNFWASGPSGMYTPFVAEPLTDSPATGDDFVVRAIGTTRVGGEHFTCGGEYQFPFHDTETFTVQSDWVAGFVTSDPLGEDEGARSPIPFVGSDIEGWLTGTAGAGTAAPAIELNQPILEGGSGTDVDAFGFRDYQFNIQAESGDVQPPLGPGGKVGDACPAPVAGAIGAPLPLSDQDSVDGWSGITTLFGSEIPAGESVNIVRYYTDIDRDIDVEDELYHVVPMIVQQEDGSVEDGEGLFTVWEIGPAHTPTEPGLQEVEWGSSAIPDDGNLYHPAALQWFDGADDAAGGVLSFGGGGDGMHYFNVDTTEYVPNEDLGEVEAGLVLSDLQIHTSGAGGRLYQLNFQVGGGGEPGDFDGDMDFDGDDMDALSEAVRSGQNDSEFDLDGNSLVNQDDRSVWVKDIRGTWFGDSNLDGEFNSSDFVAVFTGGLFETDQDATWALGDWDGDGRFNSSDFVIAFTDGGFEVGPLPAAATQSVPEPASLLLVVLGVAMGLQRMRRRTT